MSSRPTLNIRQQQLLTEDGSVFSLQSIDLPPAIAGEIEAKNLAENYLSYIKKTTLGIIRPTATSDGVEFRLAGTRASLMSFLPLEQFQNYTTLRICGGFLVQPHQCDRGEFRFGVEPEGENIRISLQLSQFCPLLLGNHSPSLLRYWLYRLTQASIHRLVTLRFLSLLYQELTGVYPDAKIDTIPIKNGRAI